MAVIAVCAVLVGFFGGVLTFRVKSRWCPRCGELTHPIVTCDRETGHV